MKAVIMDGAPWGGTMLAFPVGNELLINHLLSTLKRHGINEVAIVSGEQDPHVRELVCQAAQAQNMELLWRTESVYRGTAGSIEVVKDFLDAPTFLGIHANVYVRDVDLTAAVSCHRQYRASLTLLAQRRGGSDDALESVEIDPAGLVSRVNILHWSRNRRSQLTPCGIYVFDREVLAQIPRDEYFDVNEQLVPLLRSRGGVIRAYEIDGGGVHALHEPEDFLWLNREILLKELQASDRGEDRQSGIDEIVIGENADISPHSFLLGPLVIGPNCVVEDYVHLIGPAVIGPTSHLEKGSLVRESVLRPGTRVRGNARVEYSVVGGDEAVPEGMRLRSTYWNTPALGTHGSRAASESGYPNKMLPRLRRTPRSVIARGGQGTRSVYEVMKSVVDRTGAVIGMALVGPVLLLIAAAVRLDSRGPVFFSQKRCGKDGREFWMHKFRTMVPDAEQRQKELKARNSVDGPMFKLEEDPRITRVGKLLRKTSLDELPQLLNVLRGEMSLVGPRPLAYDEMKFCPTWRDARLTVRPGLTGLWQVKARNRNRFSEWIRYDLEYVRRRSLWLDMYILVRTARVLLKGV